MDNKKLQHYFLTVLIVGALVLTFFILRPFIYVIILALVCATVFEPVHQKVLSIFKNKKGLAALITTIIIIIVILVPFISLGILIFKEAQQFFLIINSDRDIFANVLNGLTESIQKNVPADQKLSIDIEQYIKQGLEWTLGHLGYVFGSITKLLFNFFIFIILTYYVFKDGPKFKKTIINLSPLTDEDDELILKKIKHAINSIIKGSLMVAFVQGALATIGFALFGLPNFILWGVAATLASLIPGIGTSIVIIPAVVFILLTKNAFLALGLLAWGALIVGLIDNFLRPIFIGHQTKIHPLIIFLSVIGGIIFLGPLGFLLGPLVVSLLFALLDIYVSLKNNRSG